MADLRIRPVAPIGKSLLVVHENYGPGDPRNGFYERYEEYWSADARKAGDAIRAVRRKCGLTLRKAADAAGIRPSDVSNLEHGRTTCNTAELFRRWRRARG